MPKGYFSPFTEEQEAKIKASYLSKSMKQLGREFNVSGSRVKRFLEKNNLHIPKEILEKRIKKSQYKKGSVPANKGKKQSEFMSAEAIAKTKATRFKKGNKPHNTLGLNTLVVRPDSSGRDYTYIKTKQGLELYHRYLWSQHFGKIPKGMIIIFKDQNTKNLEINNLKMISKEENMLRNSKINLPEEIIPTMALVSQLNNKINTLENVK